MNPKEKDELRERVKQRLRYHFMAKDGSWIIPQDLPFMTEFLREIEQLANREESFEHPQPLDAGEIVKEYQPECDDGTYTDEQVAHMIEDAISKHQKKWAAYITAKEKEWEEEKAELVEVLIEWEQAFRNKPDHAYRKANYKLLELIEKHTNKTKSHE